MLKEEVKSELGRDPFVPLRLHLKNGKTFDIPFREVAHDLGYGLVVFIGLRQGTRRAKGVATYFYDDILRIEQRPANRGHRRRKAS
ncbi:MAG: hypothetical protein ABSC42_16755 [Tepidisphaeraceae bacterium]